MCTQVAVAVFMLFKVQRYCLIQMRFGLNIVPAIMKSILDTVLSKDDITQQARSAYIDDIYINENIASVAHVQQPLANYRLTSGENNTS